MLPSQLTIFCMNLAYQSILSLVVQDHIMDTTNKDPEKKEDENGTRKTVEVENGLLTRILTIISYDLVLWFFSAVIHTFFREVKSRGTFNIPKKGPIVFVIAPHANQFIDPIVVMSSVKQYSRRRIAFLVAAKSYRRKFIGTGAKFTGAIPVERAQDLLRKGTGTIKLQDLEDGTIVEGEGTLFTKECMKKGLIGLPESLGNAVIESIESDTKLTLRKTFQINVSDPKEADKRRIQRLTEGTPFKVAPHVDNNCVFQHVFDHLNGGNVLGMFPEGGSHDRPDLLPLKPGVAIMALGAAAKSEDPDAVINVIPVGMNYFHPHKFRSRAVIEFGKPIKVDKKLGKKYEENPKDSVAKLIDVITLGLKEVTVTCGDYDTLMALQAARRLYTSSNRESIPLPLVVEMNRRLVKGYQKYSNDPDVIEMKTLVSNYNKKLMRMGLHDHQVESLTETNRIHTFVTFAARLFKVFLFLGLSMPGIFLFSPVFIVGRRIARKKAKEALAGSVVKIKANDVLGTWKILVALVLAPSLYIFYSIIGTFLIIKLNITKDKVPTVIIFLVCYGWSVLTTYASLRIGEIGVDYYKSLKPLFYSLLSHHKDIIQIEDLKRNRTLLAEKVTEFCNSYGPSMFEDFDRFYRQYNNIESSEYVNESESDIENVPVSNTVNRPSMSLLRSASFNINNLADVPIFSIPGFLDLQSDVGDDGSKGEHESDESSSFDTSDIEASDVGDLQKSKLRLRNAMKSKFNAENNP